MATFWDYLLVFVFACVVGLGEIVSRYRDAPLKAVGNPAAVSYIALNGIAGVATFALVRTFGINFNQNDPHVVLTLQLLASGFGAVAVLRTSLFIVHIGDKDVGVGPVTVLQVLLTAADRAVDRRRAAQRAEEVAPALRDLSFSQIKEALPRYCFTLMQNVSMEEEVRIDRQVKEIAASEMEDAVKVNALGLALMGVVGRKVLVTAADAVRTQVLAKGVHGDVYPRLLSAMEEQSGGGVATLDVLGLTLYTAWPHLQSWIEDPATPLAGWELRMRVINPEMTKAASASWLDDRWLAEARAVMAEIESYAQRNEERLRRQRIVISVRPYALAPGLHGFRINGDRYFISFVYWDPETRKIARPTQPYEYIAPDDSSVRAVHYRQLFDNWLDRVDDAPAGDGSEAAPKA